MPFKYSTGSGTKGTLGHFKLRRWGDLNKRTVNGASPSKDKKVIKNYLSKGIELRITRDEFIAWCDSNAELIEQLWSQGEVPSIDRIDPKGHYELSNMRIRSLRENQDDGRAARWEAYRKSKAAT